MSYIGNTLPANFQSLPAVQRFNGTGSATAFTLASSVANDQSILVSVDGVTQDSNAYAVSGTTLTFTAAPSSGTGNVFVHTISPVGSTVVPPDGLAITATTGTFSGALSANSYGAVSGTTGTFSGAVSSTITTNTAATFSTNVGSQNADIVKVIATGSATSANIKMNVTSSSAQAQIRLGGNNDIYFNNTTSDTTRLTIDGANGRLIQNGTGAIGGAFYSHAWNSGSGPQMGLNSTDASGNAHNYFVFQREGTQRGSISVSGSATAYNTSSDYRMKENVDYTWDATARLKQLKPARFNFIDDASNTLVDGFLAHEVSLIVPEAITGTKDAVEDIGTSTDSNGVETTNIKEIHAVSGDTWVKTGTRPVYQGIDQSKLVPLLIKTIQELEARLTALEV